MGNVMTMLILFILKKISINNNWLKDIKNILDLNNDYIYVGESNYQHPIYKNKGIIKHAMNCRRQKLKKYQIKSVICQVMVVVKILKIVQVVVG